MNTSELFDKAAAETERLQRELDITNADHIALWLETNKDDSSLGWLACRIIEAHEQSLSTLRQRIEALEGALGQIAGKNDLSMVADADVEAAARGALYECELIARQALGEGKP